MTQKEKELLLKDLCARLPYGVKIATRQYNYCDILTPKGIVGDRCYFNDNPRYDGDCPIDEFKPYLRPMSNMTEEEKKELGNFVAADMFASQNKDPLFQLTRKALFADFFNKHHIDYRGLIPMGLALEAKEGMYKNE